MKFSKSHFASFTLGCLVTGVACFYLLGQRNPISRAPDVRTPSSGSFKLADPIALPPDRITAAAPSDVRIHQPEDRVPLQVPAEVMNLLFDDAVNFHDLTILPAWRQRLKLSAEQARIVEKVMKEQVTRIGQREAKTAKLETKPNGDAVYVLEPNPEARQWTLEFTEDLRKALGPDYESADFLSAALGHSRALSVFGSKRREVYITDYTLNGATSTVVEISESVRTDPKNQSSRSYTISPGREFVKLRYPFLK